MNATEARFAGLVQHQLQVILLVALPTLLASPSPLPGAWAETAASPKSVTAMCELAEGYLEKYLASEPRERKWVLLALKQALDARKVDRLSALPHITMARAFQAEGDKDKARERAVQAVLLAPDNKQALAVLAEVDHIAAGSSALIYNFDTGETWGWKGDGSGCWSTSGGVMVMRGNQSDQGRHLHLDQEFCNFVLEVDVCKTQGGGDGKLWGSGVYVRSDGKQHHYYEFIMVHDGRYQIGKGTDKGFEKLVLWPQKPGLKQGHNQWNRLRIVAEGSLLRFYGNDHLLEVLRDDQFPCGQVALFAIDATASKTPDEVQFDNVVIRPLLRTD